MANRYWVGGTGNWSDAANHWSDSSGGVPNATFLPTASDSVFFNELSGGVVLQTVTMDASGNCLDIDFSGLVVRYNFSKPSGGVTLNIYGSILLSSFLNWSWTSQSNVYCKATTAQTITFNNALAFSISIRFDGIGGTWTLQDDGPVSGAAYMQLINGHLDLNGKAFYCNDVTIQAGTKTLSLNNGNLYAASFTVSAATGFTFNNVGTVNIVARITGNLNCTLPFYNLKLLSDATANTGTMVVLYSNITVTNELEMTGLNSNVSRLFVTIAMPNSNTSRIITAEALTASNVDFAFITGAGNANWDLSAIAGGCGNGGKNQNITFTPIKTCYWFSNSGYYSDVTKWFSESNGQGTANYFPLIHDTIIFDSNSFSATSTLSISNSMVASMDFSQVDSILTITRVGTSNNNIYCFGSIRFNSFVTFSNFTLTTLYLLGASNDISIDMQGKTTPTVYTCVTDTTYNITSSAVFYGIYWAWGTIDTNGNDFSVTTNAFIPNYHAILYFRNSTVTFYGTTISLNPDEFYAGTSTIILASTTVSNVNFSAPSQIEVYNFRIEGNLTSICILSTPGSISFNNLYIIPGKTVRFTVNSGTSFYKFNSISIDGTSDNYITLLSSSTSIKATFVNLNRTGVLAMSYCKVSYINATGSNAISKFNTRYYQFPGSPNVNKVARLARSLTRSLMGVDLQSGFVAANSINQGNVTGFFRFI